MSVRRDRVPPSGPPNGTKLQVTINHGTIPPNENLPVQTPLPAGTARVGDSVTVNYVEPLPSGVVIGGARIPATDVIEVTLGNLKSSPNNPPEIEYDVLIRRV